jgi:hypothetical protein
MKKITSILLALSVCLLVSTSKAQTSTPPTAGSFPETVLNYFKTFNTNLDSTFGSSKGTIWTGVDSLQGAKVPLANNLGIAYDVVGNLSLESGTRNGGVAGTIISEQFGLGYSFIVHDTKLTVYADGGYNFDALGKDRFYGEIGLRVMKALTEHTFAGVGLGAQLPQNRQVFSVFAGFTF